MYCMYEYIIVISYFHTDSTKPDETTLLHKSPSRSTPKRKCRDEISNLNDKFMHHWTRDEINNLVCGQKVYGNRWNTILKKYAFNSCRTANSLSQKYYKIAELSRQSFYNDKQDPYFL